MVDHRYRARGISLAMAIDHGRSGMPTARASLRLGSMVRHAGYRSRLPALIAHETMRVRRRAAMLVDNTPIDPDRRHAVAALPAALAAGASLLASAQAQAQQPPAGARPKGPRVWLEMDQAELDAAYDQRVYAPNIEQVLARYASNSELVRARLGAPRRVAYGPTPFEAMDVYLTKSRNAPIVVFVHGGAWRGGLAKDFGYAAETFVNAGAHYVVPDFINVLEAGGSLLPMADQVRRAVAWVRRNAASLGGDPERIYVCGHSSGAHLAGVVLVTDWQKDFGLPADTVKAGVLCSGLYDLKAPRLSARSNYIKFTDEMEQALSAQRHLDRLHTPIVVAHGTLETPEFQRQSRDFAAVVRAAGKPVQLVVADGYNHFELPETFANPYGILGRAALEIMRLGRA